METIPMIWMFPDLFQAGEDVENTIEFVYSVFFHLISPHIGLGIRKV